MNPYNLELLPGEGSLAEPDALLQAGVQASQSGDVEKALDLFARASAAAPRSGLPHFLIGSEYAALGEIDKAEAALANAVLLAPEFHIARYQLGLLQFSSGRAAVALVTWTPLFALADNEALGHFVRGFAALAQDDFVTARSHFNTGLPLGHDNPALCSDIEKVLQGIRQAEARGPDATPAPEPSGNHVLVSNYGRFGTLH